MKILTQVFSLGVQKIPNSNRCASLAHIFRILSLRLHWNKLSTAIQLAGTSPIYRVNKRCKFFLGKFLWVKITPLFFSLSSFWQMLQTSVKRKTCVFSFWISIVSPSDYWGTCDRHLYFWPPLTLVRHVLLFKRMWDGLVSYVVMSVRYLSSCLKISNCFCFLHLGKYHPPTYLLSLKWWMLSWC